jgi:hypothetical protein
MGKVIPEDVHAGCVEEAERLRQANKLLRGAIAASDERLARAAVKVWGDTGACYSCDTPDDMADELLALRLDLAHTEAQFEERDAMVEEAADEMAASVQAALMDAQHDHAHTLETERRLRACLARYAHALIRNGALSRPSIGGQTVTAWKCGLCGSEQASGSTAHDYVCEVCRAGLIEHAKGEELARAEGKPAEGGK